MNQQTIRDMKIIVKKLTGKELIRAAKQLETLYSKGILGSNAVVTDKKRFARISVFEIEGDILSYIGPTETL